jgi:hypothetical protein
MDRHKKERRSEDEDHKATKYTEKNENQIKVEEDKESEKREISKGSRQNSKDDVVYLSDEDIDDLLK